MQYAGSGSLIDIERWRCCKGDKGDTGERGLVGGTGKAGYVRAHKPDTADYAPNPAAQWNSIGATNRVVRTGVGEYEVTFPGLADSRSAGAAFATPLDHLGVVATITDTRTDGSDVVVAVKTAEPEPEEPGTYRLADHRFNLLFVN